ncbi:hypothetical protein ACJJTC_011971 [Scirpophaga incertulas]
MENYTEPTTGTKWSLLPLLATLAYNAVKAPGPDGVPSRVLALALGHLEKRFRAVLNLSIAMGLETVRLPHRSVHDGRRGPSQEDLLAYIVRAIFAKFLEVKPPVRLASPPAGHSDGTKRNLFRYALSKKLADTEDEAKDAEPSGCTAGRLAIINLLIRGSALMRPIKRRLRLETLTVFGLIPAELNHFE